VIVSPAPDEPTLSATPPRAREVPHLHMQNKQQIVSTFISYTYGMLSQKIHKHTHQHHQSTYLDGQTPPLEVAPCSDHPGSQPQHRGTVVSPATPATIPMPPLQ
jgi:hypothetical protein